MAILLSMIGIIIMVHLCSVIWSSSAPDISVANGLCSTISHIVRSPYFIVLVV